MEQWYAYLDGDDIGSRLELMLLEDRDRDAAAYSSSVSDAMARIRDMAQSVRGVRVVLVGGDDMLITWRDSNLGETDLEEMAKEFRARCGQGLSVGVGRSPSQASTAIRRAKLLGKNRVYWDISATADASEISNR